MSESLSDWLPPLPKGWVIKPFFSVMRERRNPNQNLDVTKVLSLSYGRVIDRNVENNYGLLPASFDGYNIVEPNDIVMRLTDMQNDQRSLRTGSVETRGIITSAYTTVTPADVLLPRFAHYLLHGYDLAKVFYRMGGGLRQSMKYDDLKRLPLVVPPKTDQELIASFLDDKTARIDALIAEKKRLIDSVRAYEQAEISRMLTEGLDKRALVSTGREFLPSAPPNWRVTAFKRALRAMGQGWSPQCDSRPAEDNEWGVLKVGCVNGTAFDASENKALPSSLEPDLAYVIQKGDVLMSRANSRELVGSVAMVETDHPNLLLCDKLYRLDLRLDWVLPGYAVLMLRSDSARRQIELGASGASSSMQNISQDVVRGLLVAFPPLDEQQVIVAASVAVRGTSGRLAVHAEEHIARLREYRASLISAAVTGQLDIGTCGTEAPAHAEKALA